MRPARARAYLAVSSAFDNVFFVLRFTTLCALECRFASQASVTRVTEEPLHALFTRLSDVGTQFSHLALPAHAWRRHLRAPTARARRTCLTGSALRLRVDHPADRPSLAIRWGISTSLNSPGRRDAPQQLLSSLRRDSSSFAQCIQDLRLLLLTMATVARSCGATHSAGLHGSVVDADVEV